jgi:hypothetical protein
LIVPLLLLRHLLSLLLALMWQILPLLLAGLMRFSRLLLKLGSPLSPALFGPIFVRSLRMLLRRLGVFLFRITMRSSLGIGHKSPKDRIPS